MADIKKNQNRDELFRTIYKIATDLVTLVMCPSGILSHMF